MDIKEQNFEEFDLSSLDDMMREFENSQTTPEEQENPREEIENEFPGDQEEDKEDIEASEDGDNNDLEDQEEQEESDNDKEEDKEEPSSHDTKDSPLTPYAKMLVEEGLLPNIDLENFDGSVDSLLEAQRKYDLERFESFKESSLDPRVKWLQDHLEEGVPLNKLLEIDEKRFTVDNINEESLAENEDLQKTVLKNYYKETTNFNEDKINKLIEKLDTLGELETESKSSLEELKVILQQKEQQEVEQARQTRAQQEEQQKEALKTFQKTLEDTKEIIPGVKVSPLLRDKIKQTLTTPVGVDPQTGMPINKILQARAENPLDFDIKMAYMFELTKGFTDWGALASSGKRKALEEFEKSVKGIDLDKGNYKPSNPPQKTRSYLDEMEQISKRF